jgi:hypothetical protein
MGDVIAAPAAAAPVSDRFKVWAAAPNTAPPTADREPPITPPASSPQFIGLQAVPRPDRT